MTKIRKTKNKKMKTCSSCGRELPLSTGFYSTKSPLFAVDGKINICKECFIGNALNDKTGEIDEIKFKNLLRKTDFPFYRDNLQSAANQYAKEHGYVSEEDVKYHGSDIIKLYMKNVNSLRQLNSKAFEDSEKDGFIQKGSTVAKNDSIDIKMLSNAMASRTIEEKKHFTVSDNFEITEDIIQLFGDGYTISEYKKMFDKYEKLKINYTLQTNIHQEALATYVRFKVKEEDATAKGNVDDAKKWYDAAQNAAEKAKLTPKQLTKADLNSGVNSVSELTKAVEQAVDVIKIMPQFKYRPNDAPDFNIWCYIDYERKLNDQPPVSYEDIYAFYDKKREEYIAQNGDPYGIFDNEPTFKNRDTVKTFIKLPDDYEELAGNEND